MLQTGADAGDAYAAIQLAELLAAKGLIAELEAEMHTGMQGAAASVRNTIRSSSSQRDDEITELIAGIDKRLRSGYWKGIRRRPAGPAAAHEQVRRTHHRLAAVGQAAAPMRPMTAPDPTGSTDAAPASIKFDGGHAKPADHHMRPWPLRVLGQRHPPVGVDVIWFDLHD